MIFIRMMRRYLASHKTLCAFFAGCVLVEVVYAVAAPLSLQYFVDTAFVPKDAQAFIAILSVLLIGGLLNIAAGAGGDYALAKMSGLLMRRMRADLFAQVLKPPIVSSS